MPIIVIGALKLQRFAKPRTRYDRRTLRQELRQAFLHFRPLSSHLEEVKPTWTDKNGEENWANWTVTDVTTFWASSVPVQSRSFRIWFQGILPPTSLPRQWLFLDSGRDAERCWSMYSRSCGCWMMYSMSARAFLRSSLSKAGSSNFVAVLSWNIKSDQWEWSQWHEGSLTKTLCSKQQSFPDMPLAWFQTSNVSARKAVNASKNWIPYEFHRIRVQSCSVHCSAFHVPNVLNWQSPWPRHCWHVEFYFAGTNLLVLAMPLGLWSWKVCSTMKGYWWLLYYCKHHFSLFTACCSKLHLGHGSRTAKALVDLPRRYNPLPPDDQYIPYSHIAFSSTLQ